MTERDLPTNTCPKCGKSMGLSHKCGLERDVEIKPDIIETTFTPESVVKCLRELADVWKTNLQDGIVCMVAADIIDKQAEQLSYQAKEIAEAEMTLGKYGRHDARCEGRALDKLPCCCGWNAVVVKYARKWG